MLTNFPIDPEDLPKESVDIPVKTFDFVWEIKQHKAWELGPIPRRIFAYTGPCCNLLENGGTALSVETGSAR